MGKYPQDFIEEVLDLFGHIGGIRQCLERGDEIIGRLLDDSSGGGLPPEEVVALLKSGRQDELLRKAEELIRIRSLYKRWGEITCPAKAA